MAPATEYQYEERSPETWKNNQERYKSGDYDTFIKDEFKTKLFKPNPGRNDIRILPPAKSWMAYQHYGLTIFRHLGIGPRNGSFLCHNHAIATRDGQELVPGRQHNKCPICALNDQARKMNTEAGKALSMKLYARPGCIVWMVDRNAMEKGPQLWIMPASKVDKEILLRAYSAKSGKVRAVDHPFSGYDVSFTYEKAGQFPTYGGVEIDLDPSPIVPDQAKLQRYLDFITTNPLPGVLKYHDVAYIAKELDGTDAPAADVDVGEVTGNAEAEHDWSSPVAVAPTHTATGPAVIPPSTTTVVTAPSVSSTTPGDAAAKLDLSKW